MRSTLIALATAGLLASGGAAAGTPAIHHNIVPVQYANQYYNPDPNASRGEERSANINEREARIKARIDRGVSDGKITNREAHRLYRELGAIEAKERAFIADGRLNHRETAELTSNLDRLAQNLRSQLRDDERSYTYYSR